MPWSGVQWEMAVGCGGLKGSRADWLVEKCTELGARSLRPLLCERSSVVGAQPPPLPSCIMLSPLLHLVPSMRRCIAQACRMRCLRMRCLLL